MIISTVLSCQISTYHLFRIWTYQTRFHKEKDRVTLTPLPSFTPWTKISLGCPLIIILTRLWTSLVWASIIQVWIWTTRVWMHQFKGSYIVRESLRASERSRRFFLKTKREKIRAEQHLKEDKAWIKALVEIIKDLIKTHTNPIGWWWELGTFL